MSETPLGPEDQREPDRERQERDPDGTAPADRRKRRRPNADDAAWTAEATYGGSPSREGEPEPDGVDPIVHRGE